MSEKQVIIKHIDEDSNIDISIDVDDISIAEADRLKLEREIEKVITSLKQHGGGKIIEVDTDGDSHKLKIAAHNTDDLFNRNFDFDNIMSSIVSKAALFFILFLILFGVPLLLAGLLLWWFHRKRVQREELLEKILASGKDVDSSVLTILKAEMKTPKQKAVNQVVWGVALLVILGSIFSWKLAMIALIPLLLGVSQLWTLKDTK